MILVMILVLFSVTVFHIRWSASVFHCYTTTLILTVICSCNYCLRVTLSVSYMCYFVSFSQFLACVLLAFLQPQCLVQAVHILEKCFIFFCSSSFLLFMEFFWKMSSVIAFLTLFVTCKISTLFFYFCRLSVYSKRKIENDLFRDVVSF